MLTQFQSNDRAFQLMQNSWAAQINPLLKERTGYSESKITAATNAGTTLTWFDATSLILPSGKYNIGAQLVSFLNGATVTTDVSIGISTIPGNDGTNLVYADNLISVPGPTATANSGGTVFWYQVVAQDTKYFLKSMFGYSAGAPQYRCKLFAIKLDNF